MCLSRDTHTQINNQINKCVYVKTKRMAITKNSAWSGEVSPHLVYVVLGFEPRVSCMPVKYSTHQAAALALSVANKRADLPLSGFLYLSPTWQTKQV